MYIQPEFDEDFNSSVGVLEKPWTVLLGELALVDGQITTPSCGIAYVPFTAESFYASFQVSALAPGNIASLYIKSSSETSTGFSLTIQDDLSVSIEAVWEEKVISTRVALSEPNAVSVGDNIIFAYWIKPDGTKVLVALKGYFELILEIPVPDWALAMPDGGHCGFWISGVTTLNGFRCSEIILPELPLVPLQHSFAANQLEADLKDAFISVFNETLQTTQQEVAAYGAPHLGSFSLVERHVSKDGLAMLRKGDEVGMRYLFKAWKNRNPKRGTPFLKTYLQVLFGGNFDISQMWQNKSLPYPNALKSEAEIQLQALDIADYFLTSRIRVDLDIDTIPENIIRSLRTALAARFVLILRISKFAETKLRLAQVAGAANVFNGTGVTRSPAKMAEHEWNFVQFAGASVVFNGYGELLPSATPPEYLTLDGSWTLDGSHTLDGVL